MSEAAFLYSCPYSKAMSEGTEAFEQTVSPISTPENTPARVFVENSDSLGLEKSGYSLRSLKSLHNLKYALFG